MGMGGIGNTESHSRTPLVCKDCQQLDYWNHQNKLTPTHYENTGHKTKAHTPLLRFVVQIDSSNDL